MVFLCSRFPSLLFENSISQANTRIICNCIMQVSGLRERRTAQTVISGSNESPLLNSIKRSVFLIKEQAAPFSSLIFVGFSITSGIFFISLFKAKNRHQIIVMEEAFCHDGALQIQMCSQSQIHARALTRISSFASSPVIDDASVVDCAKLNVSTQ